MAIAPRIRNRYYRNLRDFSQVSPGKFTVLRGGNTYTIEGGKNLGGSSRDWFLSGPGFDNNIICSSISDALRLLDAM